MKNKIIPKKERNWLSEIARQERSWRARGLAQPAVARGGSKKPGRPASPDQVRGRTGGVFWGCWAFGPITLAAREVGCQFLVLQISKKSKDPLKRERGETGDFERLCTQLISSTTKFLPVVRGHPFSELFTMNNQSLMAKLKKKKKQFLQQTHPIRIQYTGNGTLLN